MPKLLKRINSRIRLAATPAISPMLPDEACAASAPGRRGWPVSQHLTRLRSQRNTVGAGTLGEMQMTNLKGVTQALQQLGVDMPGNHQIAPRRIKYLKPPVVGRIRPMPTKAIPASVRVMPAKAFFPHAMPCA
jgi:hypothetical protein